MASELYVETLKGLTSGANANKVIIPAGQTLDASAGTLVPSSGGVVKVEKHEFTSSQTILSTSLVDVTDSEFNFTPSLSSSRLLIMCDVHYYNEASSTNNGWQLVVKVDGTPVIAEGNDFEIYENDVGGSSWDKYDRVYRQVMYTNTSTSAKAIKLAASTYVATSGNRLQISAGGGFTTNITVMEIAG